LIIAFDTWVLKKSHRNSGIYNYARFLLLEFRHLVQSYDGLTIRPFNSPGFFSEDIEMRPSPGIETIESRLMGFQRIWQYAVTTAAACSHADLVFFPCQNICPVGPIPAVVTIHDVTPVVAPSFGFHKEVLNRVRLWNSVKLSSKCITDSECSKRDIVRHYGVSPEKVTVVYLGYNREVFNASPTDPARCQDLRDRFGIRGPYIFHHGVVQPRKNLERLVNACRLLWDRHSGLDFQLVLAGPLGWQYEAILRAAKEVHQPERVIFTGALPEPDLASLLKGAVLCVIPSLYEGFCLPLVEAMACGVPTIAANTSCLPEVSGQKLLYFDPLSIEDMAHNIQHIFGDPEAQRKLAEVGLRRSSEFSWERCARETLGVLTGARAETRGSITEYVPG
jgi:glycosyltransferase involved in cell wall biosynthesis